MHLTAVSNKCMVRKKENLYVDIGLLGTPFRLYLYVPLTFLIQP